MIISFLSGPILAPHNHTLITETLTLGFRPAEKGLRLLKRNRSIGFRNQIVSFLIILGNSKAYKTGRQIIIKETNE